MRVFSLSLVIKRYSCGKSFPSSLFGLLILFFAGFALNVNLNSMEGMYLNLFLLFMLGFVQWFWILPRIARNEPNLQMLNLPEVKSQPGFTETNFTSNIPLYDEEGRTLIERVFHEMDYVKSENKKEKEET